MKITVTAYDRRTEIRLSNDIKLNIPEILNEMQLKGKVFKVKSYSDFTTHKIDRRLYIKQKVTLEKKLHEMAGIVYKPIEHVQKKTWTKPISSKIDENIITGFTGCLINDFKYTRNAI